MAVETGQHHGAVPEDPTSQTDKRSVGESGAERKDSQPETTAKAGSREKKNQVTEDLPIQESLDAVQQAKDSGVTLPDECYEKWVHSNYRHSCSKCNSGIVICPFACVPELQLSQPVWKPVVRTLETYGERLWLMGEEKQRMDGCRFTEADIASNLPLIDKMKVLASATLVIGSPNRWLWMSTVWERKIVVLYPEGEPQRKWFGFQSDNFGRILYQPDNLQVPALLACMRKLIGIL